MPIPGVRLDAATLDEIYAIWESLIAFAGDEWSNVNTFYSKDMGGMSLGFQATDAQGNRVGTDLRVINARVTISPMSASVGPGGTQQFTAAVTLPDGSTDPAPVVTWSLLVPALGTITADGLYTAPATVATIGVDTVAASHTDGGGATVIVSLHT